MFFQCFRRAHELTVVVMLIAAAALAGCSGGSSNNLLEKPPYAPAPITPIGNVEWPIAFTWTPVPGDWIYRVTVVDSAERVLYENEIRAGSRIVPADEIRSTLTGPASFTWHVALFDRNNKEVIRSKDATFTIR
jgi:hypothetical protein